MAITISPTNPAITYLGRWATATVNSVVSRVIVSGGGNPFRFRFSGTSLGLNWYFLPGYVYAPIIEARIDGGMWTTHPLVSGANAITSGLAAGTHTAEVWIRGIQQCVTETAVSRWANPPALQGIVLDDDGALTAYPTNATASMLVLGDSIAEGLVSTGINLGAIDDTQYSWGRMSFANVAATQLGIDCWTHAFGGSGFSVTTGGQPTTNGSFPYAASGIAATDPNFDIVLIEAINNDSAMSASAFRTAYSTLIEAVQAAQPTAHVICLGSFIGFAESLSPYVEELASQYGCEYLNPAAWTYTHPNADHPDVGGHASIAAYLVPSLAAAMPPPPVVVDPTGLTPMLGSTPLVPMVGSTRMGTMIG